MTGGETGIAVGIGLVVGVIPGIFGVGGGFLMVPLLHVFAGVPIPLAVGCCSAQSLGTVTTGMLHRRASGERSLRLAWLLLPGTLVGIELGIAMLERTKHSSGVLHVADRALPLMETVQLVCYLAIMLVLAAVVALETYYNVDEHDSHRRGWLERFPLPPLVALPELEGRSVSLVALTALGVLVGFLNGGFGMGGALLLVPALVFLFGVPTHRAVAVTLVSSFLAGFVSTASHAYRGNVDLRLVCLLLLGGTLGAQAGSRIAARLSSRKLRRWFAWVILASTTIILARLWQLFA
ncbi:MAG: sulfite exporter TauE/SafE family protein [Planctomycetales bacterium]|nr:sulfite exporter TauE/SafE family protein [Planctomycetales bacterium]MBN8625285.1 sulfite exporter TauE/SafE family protein [Planctomycetota bacterium]